ncbi:MAG: 4-hydroxy-tetrahydrodipicolinate synthase [Candidatus Aldehydirespiratoraceae bacterium]|jgi:4-hydroxy-tetrahydrodipicolinate synthase
MAHFGRVATAMVTPFDANGDLDVDAAVALAKFLVTEGNEGLVVAGTTGESATLTIDEKLTLFETISSAVTVPILAGTTGNNTRQDMGLTAEASKLGIAGVLAVAPYYNRPSQTGFELHFRAIASSTDLPVVLYDIPKRTGRKVSTDTMIGLANNVSNIVGLKDAAGDPGETAKVIANSPSDFEVYSGDSPMNMPLMAVGAVGVIGVSTHWAAPDHVQMLNSWAAGDIAAAQGHNRRLIESYEFEGNDDAPNPVQPKVMMQVLGHGVGECRLPMGPAPTATEAAARGVYERLVASRA